MSDGLRLLDSDVESLSPLAAYSPTLSAFTKPSKKIHCSKSVNDTEEQDDGEKRKASMMWKSRMTGEKRGLDDWEVVVDALFVDGDPARRLNLDHVVVVVPKTEGILRAWRPDDVFRPQSFPNLSKQWSFPAGMEQRYASRGILLATSSCPIQEIGS